MSRKIVRSFEKYVRGCRARGYEQRCFYGNKKGNHRGLPLRRNTGNREKTGRPRFGKLPRLRSFTLRSTQAEQVARGKQGPAPTRKALLWKNRAATVRQAHRKRGAAPTVSCGGVQNLEPLHCYYGPHQGGAVKPKKVRLSKATTSAEVKMPSQVTSAKQGSQLPIPK